VIVVVGLSHKSAPIEVRERLALPADVVPGFLRELTDGGVVSEALLVSTCNRVELIATGRGSGKLESVAEACLDALVRRAPGAGEHLYAYHGTSAVRHLFKVAASLDSLVLGEPQILGQVKDAYELAREAGTVGSVLHRTLSRAIRTAKRVRSETSIGSGQVSVPSVAVDLARQIFGELKGHQALLVGSGEMAENVARLLQGSGARILVIGRTREKVEELALSVGGEGRAWSDLKATLGEVDVVISSTSAQDFVVTYDAVAQARKSRRRRNQFYIDLAVPRDIDPAIERLDGVFLYNIDDFSRVVADTLNTRSREAELAESIIDAEATNYDRWAEGQLATPTIVALRNRLTGALKHELDRSFRGRLKHLSTDERSALEKMVEAAVNRLMHQPTMRLRRAASERSLEGPSFEQLAETMTELFLSDEKLEEIPVEEGVEEAETAVLVAAKTGGAAGR
jgi:glutamyl-tRNA reductase